MIGGTTFHNVSRLAVVAAAALVAACTTDPNIRQPIAPEAKLAAPADKGIVVLGVSLKNPKGDSFLGITRPAWIGWMQYDPATQRRVGQTMMVAGEDCSGLFGLEAGVFVRNSTACKEVQYRVYALEPGSYALAWTYQNFALTRFAAFRSADVYFNSRTSRLSSYKFSDDALVPKGGASFSVAPGEVVYIGNYTIDYGGTGAKANVGPGDVAAARKFLEPIGLADKLVARPTAPVTAEPLLPNQVPGAAL